jgi:hypothetical protein
MCPSVDVDVDAIDVDTPGVDTVDVDDVDVNTVNAVDVDDFDFEAMPQMPLTKYNNGKPAMRLSSEVDVDSVDVDDFLVFELTPPRSNRKTFSSQEQGPAPPSNGDQASLSSMLETSISEEIGDSVVDGDSSYSVNETTQQLSDSCTTLRLATKSALNASSSSLSRRKGMRKNVSFATVVSTVSVGTQRENKDQEEEKQKKLPPETTEGTATPVAGERVSQRTDERDPEPTGSQTTEEEPPNTGCIDVGNNSNRKLLEKKEDGSFSKDNQSTSPSSPKSDRPRRVPMAQMDPAERKAKQKKALKEAALVAQKVRQLNKSKARAKSTQNPRPHGEASSVVSGVSNTSSLTHDGPKQKKAGFLKNPFKRRSKYFDVDSLTQVVEIPIDIESDNAGAGQIALKQSANQFKRDPAEQAKKEGTQ